MLDILVAHQLPNPENPKILKILILMMGCGRILKMPAWTLHGKSYNPDPPSQSGSD
jgi:hypothetical protein